MLNLCARITGLSLLMMLGVSQAQAELGQWWPLKVIDASSGKDVEIDYVPLAKAAKAHNICVLFPHMKDSYWLAVDYGVIEEAKRLGVNVTVYEAGGYENLSRQLSQFDDCLSMGAEAIVIGGVSEGGMAQKYNEAMQKGIPVISVAVPVTQTKIASKVYADFQDQGAMTGRYLLDNLKGAGANVVTFPGPAGSGWAEGFNDGFKSAVKDSAVKVLGEEFGDTGVQAQLQLVQDALQAHPEMDTIWGTAVTAEAAIGAVAQAGRAGEIKIISAYENMALVDAVKRGDILGFGSSWVVANGAIGLDQAVRAIEGKSPNAWIKPIPAFISKENIGEINMDLILAPADFAPVFSVKN